MALTVIPKVAGIVDDTDVEKFLAKWLSDFFVTGFTPSIGAGLSVNIALGDAMLKGHEVNESANTSVTVPASTTSSIWLALTRDVSSKVNGVQYTVAVAQPADSIKVCDFVSGVSTVTTVTDLRISLMKLFAPNAGKFDGTIVLINADETDASDATGSTAEITLKSFSLPANTYSRIIVESEIEMQFPTVANMSMTFRLKYGATIVESKILDGPSVTTGPDVHAVIKGSQAQTAAVTITVTVQRGIASGVTARAYSLRVYGVI